MNHWPLLLVLALLAPLAVADTTTTTYAPSGVAVAGAGEAHALVTWLPGEELPDSYRVYGAQPGGWTLLLDTTTQTAALAALVPGGYASYGVAGVRDGIESRIVSELGLGCITIYTSPHPGVSRECPTGTAAPVADEVRRERISVNG